MARPKKEGMDYFPHDTDAVNDEKVEALRMLYGNDGYAFYFILLERIYRSKNAELDVSDAETMQILSRKVGIQQELFDRILETSLKRDCFDRESFEVRGVLTSSGIKKRIAPVIEKRENMRRKYVSDKENDSLPVSDAETPQKPDKVKESKVKESKEETINLPLQLFEHYISKSIMRHHSFTASMKTAASARLKVFSFEQLIEAIDNYAIVYKGEEYWFTYKYSFTDLMREKDILKFINDAEPLNNFSKNKDAKAPGHHVPAEKPVDTVIDINAGEDW